MISTNDIIRLVARVGELLHGARLTGLEIPREDYDALLDAHRKEMQRYTFELPRPPESFLVFKLGGVTITKAEIPVSKAMSKAGELIIASHRGMDSEVVATRVFRAMREAEDKERGRV